MADFYGCLEASSFRVRDKTAWLSDPDVQKIKERMQQEDGFFEEEEVYWAFGRRHIPKGGGTKNDTCGTCEVARCERTCNRGGEGCFRKSKCRIPFVLSGQRNRPSRKGGKRKPCLSRITQAKA